MTEKQFKNKISARAAWCWRLLLLFLLLLSCALQMTAFVPELNRQQKLLALLHMLGGFLLAICFREYQGRRKGRLPAAVLLLPILLLFLLLGPAQVLAGFFSFQNRLFAIWNEGFDAGLPVRDDLGTAASPAFVRFLFCLAGFFPLSFYCRSHFLKGFACLLILLLPLLSGCSVPMAAVLLLTAFLGEWMTEGEQFSRRRVIWTAGAGLFLLLCIGMDRRGEITAVRNFRSGTEKTIRELRYGKDTLPEGDLRQAGELQASEEHMLTVSSTLAKNLYLRGFVGGRYADGCWQPLRRSDFSTEDRSGMLQWLQTRGFSVLKAPAEYWSLGGGEKPPENRLEIRVEQASRAYLYLPATVSLLDEQHLHRELDNRYTSSGLLGERKYSLRERSDSRPAELLTAADWLTAPQTEAQQNYCSAEAEYRTLVHALYTETDSDLTDLLQQFFWTDYDTENAGIYRAVSRVRRVLSEKIQYTENPAAAPADTDPIRWMLCTSKEGNAVLFAAAAAEALRLQGIPTRYVEGYYASEAAFLQSSDGSVELSGRDAHAWVEIYFDGIGWLPVDVTPGYYYDAVLLQQMVNAPELVHKTAAEEKSQEEMDILSSREASGHPRASERETSVRKLVLWGQYLLGLLVLVLLLLMLAVMLLLLRQTVQLRRDRRRYHRLPPEKKIAFLQERILRQLRVCGIPVTLGLAAAETDRQLTERFPQFPAGTYLRVSEILEKAVYGGVVPEAYELRTLEDFSRQLARLPLFGMESITSGNLTARRIFDIMKTLT